MKKATVIFLSISLWMTVKSQTTFIDSIQPGVGVGKIKLGLIIDSLSNVTPITFSKKKVKTHVYIGCWGKGRRTKAYYYLVGP